MTFLSSQFVAANYLKSIIAAKQHSCLSSDVNLHEYFYFLWTDMTINSIYYQSVNSWFQGG